MLDLLKADNVEFDTYVTKKDFIKTVDDDTSTVYSYKKYPYLQICHFYDYTQIIPLKKVTWTFYDCTDNTAVYAYFKETLSKNGFKIIYDQKPGANPHTQLYDNGTYLCYTKSIVIRENVQYRVSVFRSLHQP